MVSLTYAQKLAFSEMIAQFIQDHEAKLKAAGFNAAKKLAELERSLTSAIQFDTQQETMKAELAKATEKAVKALESSYRQASSLTDAMVGTLGKHTHLSKRLRQLRDQMVLEAARGKQKTAS